MSEQTTKHQFTPEETIRGWKSSRRTRSRIAREAKKLLGMELTARQIDSLLEAAAIYVSTPMGQLILSLGILEIAHRTGLLTVIPAKGVAEVLVSETVISALGQSNIISQVGSLIGGIGSKATEAAIAA